jgi:hypothetical protein
MSLHLLNLAFRFCLEMTCLIAVGMWGWHQADGWMRWLLTIGLPLILSTMWGVFNVPNDPSRGGGAPVPVPGLVRLLIEVMFFSCGGYALITLGYSTFGSVFIFLLVLHYLLSFRRIAWLLSKKGYSPEG